MLATTQTHQSLSTRFDELEVELQVHPGQDTSRHIVTCLFFSKHGQQIRAERVRQAFLHVADACRREEDAGTTWARSHKVIHAPRQQRIFQQWPIQVKSLCGLSSPFWASEASRSSKQDFFGFVSWLALLSAVIDGACIFPRRRGAKKLRQCLWTDGVGEILWKSRARQELVLDCCTCSGLQGHVHGTADDAESRAKCKHDRINQ